MVRPASVLWFIWCICAIVCFSITPALVAHAQQQQTQVLFVALSDKPASGQQGGQTGILGLFQVKTLGELFNKLFIISVTIIGLATVYALVKAAVQKWFFGDRAGSISSANTTISNAVWGFLLFFSIYLILQVINPKLLDFNVLETMKGSSQTNIPSQGSYQITNGFAG